MSWKCRGVTASGDASRQHPECDVTGRFCEKCGLLESEVASSSSGPLSSGRPSLPIARIIIGLLVVVLFSGLSFFVMTQLLRGRQPYHRSSSYGVGLNYPEDWELREPQEDYPPDVIAATKDLFQVVAPNSGQGPYRENVLAKIEQVANPPFLDEYADKQVARIEQIGTYDIESSQNVSLAGSTVRELVYSGNNGEYSLKRKRIIVAPKRQGDYFILLTYTADSVDYETYLPEVNKMLERIDLLD